MQEEKKPVALVFGGLSPEHEISIQSALKVAAGIQSLPDYQPVPVYISREGRWHWSRPSPDVSGADLVAAVKDDAAMARRYQPRGIDFAQALLHLTVDEYATIFIILHGENGEDGRLQGALELAGLRYTGSGSAASALALDKPRCQAYLAARGLPVAPFIALDARTISIEAARESVLDSLDVPCVVKPALGGSSVGVTIVPDAGALDEALSLAFSYGPIVLVERFVKGREFTCGVIEKPEPRALPITEIVPPPDRFFDYEAKYTPGMTREVTPAPIGEALSAQIGRLAVEAHRAVGCEGFSRVDFIADEGGPKILEVNTIPGMTETSLLPQAAAAADIGFADLMRLIIEHSIRRGERARGRAACDA